MANESPFFTSRIECPICKTVNELETVRVGAYVEKGRDTDFCPTEIEWRYARYQNYNPLLYFTATCENCFYTREFNNSFKEWKKDANFTTYRLKSVKPKHLDMLAAADSVIKRLGEARDPAAHPNETAVIKLHLAALDEEFCDHPSYLDLGRFYLRIGWVFRSMNKVENPSQQLVRGLISELDNCYGSMDITMEDYTNHLVSFRKHAESQFEAPELPAGVKSQMLPFREGMTEGIDKCQDKLNGLRRDMASLQEVLNEYKQTVLGTEGGSANMNFGSSPSFNDFLRDVRKTWDGVALNEQQALEKAVQYYAKAFEGGRDISPGYQQLQASYLIAELSRRIGDHDGARQYFNSTIKYGQDFIYRNRNDRSRTALARKILELAIEQGRTNMEAIKK